MAATIDARHGARPGDGKQRHGKDYPMSLEPNDLAVFARVVEIRAASA